MSALKLQFGNMANAKMLYMLCYTQMFHASKLNADSNKIREYFCKTIMRINLIGISFAFFSLTICFFQMKLKS